MAQYRCIACGYKYRSNIKFNELDDDWKCPLCNSEKTLFEEADEFTKKEIENIKVLDQSQNKAVVISKNNPSIERIAGCINCGICKRTCIQREKMPGDEKCLICVGCGQCIITCPKNVLQPKNDIYKFLKAKKDNKICIATIAPSSRVSIGDEFGYERGEFLQEKLVGLLKTIGFDYVFDITFGADLTIMEEASELIERIDNNGKLPMFTSCCPAWVKYVEVFYPELIPNLTTCKSPISMHSAIINKYFTQKKNINPKDIFVVSIVPCTAKKSEIARDEIEFTDCAITVSELSNYIKCKKIDLEKVKEENFESIIGEGSGAGLIFGNSGGVMEAALRTASYMANGKDIEKIEFEDIRGYNGVKEATIKLGNRIVRVAAVDEIANALPIIEDVKNNTSKYDYIEVMNCRGGCIGGGGQPKYKFNEEQLVKEKRIESIYKKDKNLEYRCAHENPEIQKVYKEFLGEPLKGNAEKLLHTFYKDKSSENINKPN